MLIASIPSWKGLCAHSIQNLRATLWKHWTSEAELTFALHKSEELTFIVIYNDVYHVVNSLGSTLQRAFGNIFKYGFHITTVNVKKCNCDCYRYLIVQHDAVFIDSFVSTFALSAKLLKFIERILDAVIQFGVPSMSFGVTVSSKHSLHITVFIYTKRGHAIYVKNLFPLE